MGTSRMAIWALVVSVSCLSSMLAVTALSDAPADPPASEAVDAVPSDAPSAPPAAGEAAAVARSAAQFPAPPAPTKAVSIRQGAYEQVRPVPQVGGVVSFERPSLDPEKTTVSLKGGLALQGDLVDMEHLKIKTEYGELSVPIKLVGSIHWKGASEKTTVQMRNGDRLTGRLDEKTLKLRAVWGDVSLDTRHVVRVACGAPTADQPAGDFVK